MRKLLTAFACAAVFVLALVTTGCPSSSGSPQKVLKIQVTDGQIRSGARVVKTAAEEYARRLDTDVQRGIMDAADRDALKPIVDEVTSLSNGIATDSRNFDTLTKAERRALIVDYIDAMNRSAQRLNDAGALHIKNEKSLAAFNRITGVIDDGVFAARIVLAALPPDQATRQ
jgi:hypothetical protein